MTPYDLFDSDDRRRQEEVDNPDLWTYRRRKTAHLSMFSRMRADSDLTPPPVIDGYDVVLALARRERGLDAA